MFLANQYQHTFMIVMSMNYIVPVTLLLLELPRPLEMVSAPHVVVQGVLINDKSLAIKKFQGLIEIKKKLRSLPLPLFCCQCCLLKQDLWKRGLLVENSGTKFYNIINVYTVFIKHRKMLPGMAH